MEGLSLDLQEMSVTEVSFALKGLVETSFAKVRVRGEISGFKRHTSGHLYFALKDDQSVLDAVCWKGMTSKLATNPSDGMEVICVGKLTTYPGRSKYQMVVEQMELSGEGVLLKVLEDRRRRLSEAGLFDEAHKKPLPFFPARIGIVTSPTGAVIMDILHRLVDRCPAHVLLWGVAVQGEGAAAQVADAIAGFNTLTGDLRPDVIIVARGGGSLEDLWAFNEEEVVRAVYDSQIPVVSGVGHEPDITLIDYVADRRAPTPTAAAEMVVPVRAQLVAGLALQSQRMASSLLRLVNETQQRFDDRVDRLERTVAPVFSQKAQVLLSLYQRLRHPRDILQQKQMTLAHLKERLMQAGSLLVERHTAALERAGGLLQSYSYHATLQRGFTVVRGEQGQYLKRASEAKAGTQVSLVFYDDVKTAVITGEHKPLKEKKNSEKNGTTQPSLFS